jgi:hypothetical protein
MRQMLGRGSWKSFIFKEFLKVFLNMNMRKGLLEVHS